VAPVRPTSSAHDPDLKTEVRRAVAIEKACADEVEALYRV
jgi:hypothetical protein